MLFQAEGWLKTDILWNQLLTDDQWKESDEKKIYSDLQTVKYRISKKLLEKVTI